MSWEAEAKNLRRVVKELTEENRELKDTNDLLRAENAMWQQNPEASTVPRAYADDVYRKFVRARDELAKIKVEPGQAQNTMIALQNDNRELIEQVKALHKQLRDAGHDPVA